MKLNEAFLKLNQDLLYFRSKNGLMKSFLHGFYCDDEFISVEWVNIFNLLLDGITCISERSCEILRKSGVLTPAAYVGFGLDHWERIVPIDNFNLNSKKFKFLHVASGGDFKLLLESYGQSFTSDDEVSLIIEISESFCSASHACQQLNVISAQYKKFPHVLFLKQPLSSAQRKALYDKCDVLIETNTLECKKMMLTEALLSGIQVIAPQWSGYLDILTSEIVWYYEFQPQQFFKHPHQEKLASLSMQMQCSYVCSIHEKRVRIQKARSALLKEYSWLQTISKMINSLRISS